MKKISKISGVKKLNRNDLKEIKGGSCIQLGDKCCLLFPNGQVFCDTGICVRDHACIYSR